MASTSIVCRKMIKPSSPTPPSLRRHSLTLMDYTNLNNYMPIAAFYSKPPENFQVSHILETSLSKVLSSYYPFAGQPNHDNTFIDCNDMGAEYVNVRINCPMSQILNHFYNDVAAVFPQDLPWSNSSNRTPLVIQLSHFDCGGIAVSVCLSHKIADAYTLFTFLNDWASTARDDDFKPSPQFNASSFFPPPALMDDIIDHRPPLVAIPVNNNVPEPQPHVSKIFNFSSSSLARLKAEATNSGVVLLHNPTRIEVATALVHKCGAAVFMEKWGVFKPTVLSHIMNLRPQIIPLNTMGNTFMLFGPITKTEDDTNLPNFVALLQKAKQQLLDELSDMTNTNQIAQRAIERNKYGAELIESDKYDCYSCTSCCKFGLYTIDFGWGRPVRVTLAGNTSKNHFLFMDDPTGDGLNVLVTLTEADMSIFQSNKELLQFATPVAHSAN